MFTALQLSKSEAGLSAAIAEIQESQWPPGDSLARVGYSVRNYKDGLAITNTGAAVRNGPMVAGVDGAGSVLESTQRHWKAGGRFVHNGWGLSETRWGLMAERARLQGDWLVKLPQAFSTRQAMATGTAGYTAKRCELTLEQHGSMPGNASAEVLVTGGSGGVGRVAVALLSKPGYNVVAATGKATEKNHHEQLGAARVIDRAGLSIPGKPLQKARWAAVVDAMSSYTLANACAQTRYGGVVTARGLAQGVDFPSKVMPYYSARHHVGRHRHRDGSTCAASNGMGS